MPKTTGLTPEAEKLFSKIKKMWAIADEPGVTTLRIAMQALDRLREAQAILATDGIIVEDRWKQKKAHPATVIEREARAGLLMALKALNLDLETLTDAAETEEV